MAKRPTARERAVESPRAAAARPRRRPASKLVALFEQLTASSLDYHALVDRRYRIRYMNPAHCRARGVTLAEVTGKHLAVVTGERSFEDVLRASYERCFAGETVQLETWIDYRVPGPSFIHATYVPLRGTDGEVEFAAVSLHDVTADRQDHGDHLRAREKASYVSALRESEELNRRIVETAREGIWVVAPDLHTTFVNPAMARLLRCTAGAITGRPCADLFAPATWEEARRLLDRRPDGRRADGELPLVCHDGITRTVRLSAVPLRDEAGEYLGTMVFVTDLTARKRAETTARRLTRALRTLSECNEALVRATDETELLQRVCDLITGVGGYRMAWVGFTMEDEAKSVRPVACAGVEDGYLARARISWGDNERGRGPTGRCIRSGEAVVARQLDTFPEYEPWRDQAMRRGYASSAALPLVVEERSIGALMIYASEADAFDDDELRLLRQLADDLGFGLGARRARRERERMHAQLLLADRMSSMGMLAAGVAHEINNPLSYTLANLELMARDLQLVVAANASGDEPVAKALTDFEERIRQGREGATRVRDIVRDLKLFSRVDEETVGLVDLRRVLDASVRMIWNEIKHRGRLVRDYGELPLVRANEARLGQVVLNLLTNAVQALPEAWHEHSEIRVVGRTDEEGRAVIEVCDTGVGIAAEHLPRIFDPFFTTKPVGIGTGLGLPICQVIVTALGGEIIIESAPHQGCTVRVVLPPAQLATTAPRPAAPSVAAPPARPGRILVVDDEEHLCALMQSALAPHEVVTQTDAGAALDRLGAGERFDVIFCDMMMPQMTGMDFHARLADFAPQLAERVVFMTGGAFTASARDFLAAVPNAHLEKPFELAQLQALVRDRLA